MNPQAAGIRRAQIAAHKETLALDKDMLTQLLELYKTGAKQLVERLGDMADGGHVRIEYLQSVIAEIDQHFQQLEQAQAALLVSAINTGAEIGASVVSTPVTVDAVASVWQTTQADGLNLSQRLWRLNTSNKQALIKEIQLSLVRGDSAFKAARDFINNGVAVPDSIAKDANLASENTLKRITVKQLLTGEGNALYNAQRLFRTEIARAHSLAYMDSVENIDGIIGYKFNLSSAHKRTDICDLHAKANLYGLGSGVYPKKVIARIYPAHPQTTSFITAVWDDEVSHKDKQRDKNRLHWLKQQSNKTQDAILGKQKGEWLRQGLLTERTINSRVSALKKRFKIE